MDWSEAIRATLDKLNIQSEYSRMGLEITGREPNRKGWIKCRAIDREDRHPSGEINVGNGPGRGRYHDWVTCENMSLFDFAVWRGLFPDFASAFKHYAEQAGVKFGNPKQEKKPEDSLAFEDWNDATVQFWCSKTPGVNLRGVRLAGGRLARSPKKTRTQALIVLPIYSSCGVDGDPIGYQAVNRTGGTLPVYRGKGVPADQLKVKTVAHSKAGWMGVHGLHAMESARVVWKVEGFKDLIALQGAIPQELLDTHVVVTNSGGASEIPRPEFLEMFAGKIVYVLGDADNPGQGIYPESPHLVGGARLWCREISRVADEVRNVMLPYPIEPKSGKDVRDYIAEGATYADLLALAVSGELFQNPDAPKPEIEKQSDPEDRNLPSVDADLRSDQTVVQALRLMVLGETPDGKVKIHSLEHRKTVLLPDVSKLTYEDLLQVCGPIARDVVNLTDVAEVGKFSMRQIKESIAILAGYRRLNEENERGRGVWFGRDENGVEDGTILLVNGGEAATLNGSCQLERLMVPQFGNLMLDMGSSKQWYSFSDLNSRVERAHRDRGWIKSVVDQSLAFFNRWEWKCQSLDPTIVTGLVMASWVQTLWRWRPMVAIVGGSNTGKSTLFSALGGIEGGSGIFGDLAILSSQSSEAGIRQAIRHGASVLLCDEFEDSRDRAKVLNLFRTSSRGAKILRGTANQGGEAYGMQHVPWVAAIEVGLKREPDRNRFITLELVPPPPDRWGKLTLPDQAELVDMGQSLLAIALTHSRTAVELAVNLKSTKIEGVDKRVIESYSVPAAMLASAYGLDQTSASELLGAMLEGVERGDQGRSDVFDLLGDILAALVDCGRGVRMTVSQLLTDSKAMFEHLGALEASGIALSGQGDDRIVFLAHRSIAKLLLRGTGWENQSIDQILRRVPGAMVGRRAVAGQFPHGVSIPLRYLEANHMRRPD